MHKRILGCFALCAAFFLCTSLAYSEELPTLRVEKRSVEDAPAGMYVYELMIRNESDQPLERIFVEEFGPAGAFVSYQGNVDVLLNQNGTATILSLASSTQGEGGDTVILRYEAPLPSDFQGALMETSCNVSMQYTSPTTGKRYELIDTAMQPIAILHPTPTPAPTSTPFPAKTGGVLTLTLSQTEQPLSSAQRVEQTLTLANQGSGVVTSLHLYLDAIVLPDGSTAEGAWIDKGELLETETGMLLLPEARVLLPGEAMVFRCYWQLPALEEGTPSLLGAAHAWGMAGTEARQDVCATFTLQGTETPWQLTLSPGIVLSQEDLCTVGIALLLCAVLILFYRPRCPSKG